MDNEYIAEEIRQATTALEDAEYLLGKRSDEAVVNRLYYACFHASSAVLASKGIEVKSHRGLVSVFGEKVVMVGEADAADGRFLSEIQTYRQVADYGHKSIDADVTVLFERTEKFVEDMIELA